MQPQSGVDFTVIPYYSITIIMGAIKLSKLTEKYQTTVPAEVRETLHLKKGDAVIFEIKKDHTVTIRKATDFDHEWAKSLESTLSEWASEEDEEAYRDL